MKHPKPNFRKPVAPEVTPTETATTAPPVLESPKPVVAAAPPRIKHVPIHQAKVTTPFDFNPKPTRHVFSWDRTEQAAKEAQ